MYGNLAGMRSPMNCDRIVARFRALVQQTLVAVPPDGAAP